MMLWGRGRVLMPLRYAAGNGHGCKLLPISPPPGGRGTTAALGQGGAGGDGGVG